MIRVQIKREANSRSIRSFKVEGHADFAKTGKDIVCAGVSAVTQGTVNAVEAVAGVRLAADVRTGYLSVVVPEIVDEQISAKVQLLLESMMVMLESIRQSYTDYIRIQEITK